MQGFRTGALDSARAFGLGPLEKAFPNGVFPTGTIHEFVCGAPEHRAASGGFIAGVLGQLMVGSGACLWISRGGIVFPPALSGFGVSPEQVIFVRLPRERDVLWAMGEALKCGGLAAVTCELSEISFSDFRRLQLAVEQSKVTGFVVINDPKKVGATTGAARWRITPLPIVLEKGMPGVGLPRWQVELLKVRGGNPGSFQLGWSAGRFIPLGNESASESFVPVRKAG